MSYTHCLSCGKKLTNDEERLYGWHKACVKRFFGVPTLPLIDLSNRTFESLALEQSQDRQTVTGIQKKLSAHVEKGGADHPSRLTLIGCPSGYILKPQSDEYKHLPEMEATCMLMADEATILTVPHGLIELPDGNLGYISKRIDRLIKGNKVTKLPMEDFCQAALISEENKYRASYELCGELVDRYSKQPLLDKTNLFKIVYFSFLSGNSDMHLKNFSFIGNSPLEYRLSPSYDLLCTRLAMPTDIEDLALSLNGKKTSLTGRDFLSFASAIGISETVARKIIAAMNGCLSKWQETIKNSQMNEAQQAKLLSLIEKNIRRAKL